MGLQCGLKTINEFHYDHSEKLGDAFEYLLSVLGSQGDAGQFRTPRHIIDFIVQVMQPKKNETICDPACGTAGFLISAYKYILKQNSGNSANGENSFSLRGGREGLTPDDRKKLMQHFVGYDISPDMVRLSLVNMYLHNFTSPRVYEYDTLTSEDRWGEYFDIILANPPFMSPKGGIKPHKKFSLQANRSEVLFVDYIAEHINPTTGRAGIIVPEGIIFQSGKAYKQLRQMLVDKRYLYAVVSLPAGIFQPYSGVKTSVLLMDRTLAKKTDNILFVKIENDGFDLGAQRRAIEKNDLTAALIHLQEYKDVLINNTAFVSDNKNVFVVDKKKIKGTGDYNLSVDRYRVNESVKDSKWEMMKLEKLVKFVRGVTYAKDDEVSINGYKVLRASNITLSGSLDLSDIKLISKTLKLSDEQKLKANDIFICIASGSAEHIGKTTFIEKDTDFYFGGFMAVIRVNEKLLPKYLFYNLRTDRFNLHLNNSISGANIKNLKSEILYSFEVPLPPLFVQQEIVAKIETYQRIIDGAKQVVENYKPQIDVDPEWEMVQLGSVCEKIQIGPFGTQLHQDDYQTSGIPIINPKHIKGSLIFPLERISKEKANSLSQYYLRKGDVIMARRGEMGRVAYIDKEQDGWFCGTGSLFIRFNKNYNGELYAVFLSDQKTVDYLEKASRGVTMANLNLDIIQNLLIPKPDKPEPNR